MFVRPLLTILTLIVIQLTNNGQANAQSEKITKTTNSRFPKARRPLVKLMPPKSTIPSNGGNENDSLLEGKHGKNTLYDTSDRTKRDSSPSSDNVYKKWGIRSKVRNVDGKRDESRMGFYADNENPERRFFYHRSNDPSQITQNRRKRSRDHLRDSFFKEWSYDSIFKNVNGNHEESLIEFYADHVNPEGTYKFHRKVNPNVRIDFPFGGFVKGGGFHTGFSWSSSKGINFREDKNLPESVTTFPSVPSVTPV